MDAHKFQFLREVLGTDGAAALKKASERSPALGGVLIPRAIMAWLGIAARDDFEGSIPGVDNSYLQFAKNEDKYSGSISIGESVYSFDEASMMHVGAYMAVALGADADAVEELRDLDLQRIGRNIDTLVKARVAVNELRKKILDPASGITIKHRTYVTDSGQTLTDVDAIHPKWGYVGQASFHHTDDGKLKPIVAYVHPESRRQGVASAMYAHAEKHTGRTVIPSSLQSGAAEALWAGNAKSPQFGKAMKSPQGNAEAPGPAHAPAAPQGPQAPLPPDPTQNSKGPTVGLRPKPPKLPTPKASTDVVQTGTQTKQPKSKSPTLKVTKSLAAERKCEVCEGHHFKEDSFVGCVCLRDLSKSVKTHVTDEGYLLELDSDLDEDSILTLIEAFEET